MLQRLFDRRPIQTGLRRAGVHMARAVYEVVAGVGVFVEEIVTAVTDDDDEGDESDGPVRIELE